MSDDSDLLTDSEMTRLLRLIESHHPAVPRDRPSLRQRTLDEFDQSHHAQISNPIEIAHATVSSTVKSEAPLSRRRRLTQRLLLAGAAAAAVLVWVSQPGTPPRTVVATETTTASTTVPEQPSVPLTGEPLIPERSFDLEHDVQVAVPDGMVLAESSPDRLTFARTGSTDPSDGRISLIATGTTDMDDEISRMVDAGMVVVNDSRVNIDGELFSRWEAVVSNATAAELGCIGTQPCLTVVTDRGDVTLWSGALNFITTIEMAPGANAAWLARPKGYNDPLAFELSREFLHGLTFD